MTKKKTSRPGGAFLSIRQHVSIKQHLMNLDEIWYETLH